MSKDYSIIATVNFSYSMENIFEILLWGKDLGFIYLQPDLNQYDPALLNKISLKIASSLIMQHENNYLVVKYEDTFFYLYLLENNSLITICFNHFLYPWYKKYQPDNIEDIDIARYTEVLFDFIEPWQIVALAVEKK